MVNADGCTWEVGSTTSRFLSRHKRYISRKISHCLVKHFISLIPAYLFLSSVISFKRASFVYDVLEYCIECKSFLFICCNFLYFRGIFLLVLSHIIHVLATYDFHGNNEMCESSF